jgi:hypothetical protein
MLVTRAYLELTGFPRVGGGGLHIAHLLWGGLLLLVGLIGPLAYVGAGPRRFSAIVGGIGFGLFIDELGKFITSDNDYFFQPAIALIYLVFITLFLVFRALEHGALSGREQFVNAVNLLTDLVQYGSKRDRQLILHLMDQSRIGEPLTGDIRTIVGNVEIHAESNPSVVTRFGEHAWSFYDRLIAWPLLHWTLLIVFPIQAALGALATVFPGANTEVMRLAGVRLFEPLAANPLLAHLATLSAVVSFVLVLFGVARLRHSRLSAYRWFERSVLVAIFFTQVLLFWQDQLSAIGGLAWNLFLFSVLRFLISQEEARTGTAKPTVPSGASPA